MRLCFFLIVVFHFSKAQFQRIYIGKANGIKGFSIKINTQNQQHIIAAASKAGAWQSRDGGLNWKPDAVKCDAIRLYDNPVILWIPENRAFLCDLVSANKKYPYKIGVYGSDQSGKLFNACTYVNQLGDRIPWRQSFCTDDMGQLHLAFTLLDKPFSHSNKHYSDILYCNAVDGKSWSFPKKINSLRGNCALNDSTLLGSSICSSDEGEVFVCWSSAEGLMFQKSVDNGNTWLSEERNILPLNFSRTFISRFNQKASGLPHIAIDKSTGNYRGRIYVCWSDLRGGKYNADVFLIFSDDKGENWSEPVLLTYYPNHKAQFLPFLSIDQSNGNVYVIYYNQENSMSGEDTDVYLAVSSNGGLKFENYKLNEKGFRFKKNSGFGDYLALDAAKGTIRPMWMEPDDNNGFKVCTSIVNDSLLMVYNEKNSVKEIEMAKTVSFAEKINLNFKVRSPVILSAAITKPLDSSFEKVVLNNIKFEAGEQQITIDFKKLGLEKSNYIVTFYFNNTKSFAWILADK